MFDGRAVKGEETKDGWTVWSDDLHSFGAGLVRRMAATRPHLVRLAPVEQFGRPHAGDAAGWAAVYGTKGSKEGVSMQEMMALHTWQGERERRKERKGEVVGVEDPAIPALASVQDVCRLADGGSLYGAALKRALLAGTGHEYACE